VKRLAVENKLLLDLDNKGCLFFLGSTMDLRLPWRIAHAIRKSLSLTRWPARIFWRAAWKV